MKLTQEEKQARAKERGEAKRIAAHLELIARKKAQPAVRSITITIEWKKSRMWGYNPHAEAIVEYSSGECIRKDKYTTSGCGYDKESTVIAAVFNDFLVYELYNARDKPERPYGFNNYAGSFYYGDGIGVSCYYKLAEFIGGKFEQVANGKSFGVYRYVKCDNAEAAQNREIK